MKAVVCCALIRQTRKVWVSKREGGTADGTITGVERAGEQCIELPALGNIMEPLIRGEHKTCWGDICHYWSWCILYYHKTWHDSPHFYLVVTLEENFWQYVWTNDLPWSFWGRSPPPSPPHNEEENCFSNIYIIKVYLFYFVYYINIYLKFLLLLYSLLSQYCLPWETPANNGAAVTLLEAAEMFTKKLTPAECFD